MPIDEVPEHRHEQHRKQRFHPDEQRRAGGRHVPRVDQELLSERLERKDARVERDTETREQPERSVELQEIAEDESPRVRRRLSQVERRFPARVQDPVQGRADDAQRAEPGRHEQGPSPVRVGRGRPRRGRLRGERSEPAGRCAEREREAELGSEEPSGDRHVRRHRQRLAANTEDQPAGSHHRNAGAGRGHHQAGEDDRPEEEHRPLGANAIDEQADGQQHEDVRKTVRCLQQADLGIRESQLAGQERRERADGVERIVTAEHRDADRGKHRPAGGARRPGLRGHHLHVRAR